MASHVVVIDTSFRRATVQVGAGKFMTDVLEEACRKLNLKASNYGLKHKNKAVDLSLTFRQTGFAAGAKLELVVASRSPSVVSVALQLPDSLGASAGRLVDKFPSDTTLWLILRKFEATEGKNLNFTQRGVSSIANGGTSGPGRIYYEMPTLTTLGRPEISSFADLQKTLQQLGLNGGSVLIRLGFRQTEQPLEEAMQEISQYFKEEDSIEKKHLEEEIAPEAKQQTVTEAMSRLSSNEPPGTEPQTESTETSSSTKRPAPESSTDTLLGPNKRPIEVYSAPSSETPQAARTPHNEMDYEPTIAHAKMYQSRLQNNSQNKKLLSDAELEAQEQERAAKQAATKEVTIQIRFPDQTRIQSSFTAADTASSLHNYVREVIAAEDEPFKLTWSGKGVQVIAKNEKLLIRDLGFSGRMLVTFSWQDAASASIRSQPTLKSQYLDQSKAVPVPLTQTSNEPEESKPTAVEKGKDSDGGGKGKGAGGMPKWFKGLGKK